MCALDGQDKLFKRKDHLNQHLRNCHRSPDSPPWRYDSLDNVQCQVPARIDFPTTCSSPINMAADELDTTAPQDLRDDGLGLCSSVRPHALYHGGAGHTAGAAGHQSPAVVAIKHALADVVKDSDQLHLIKVRLDLPKVSTTEQLARNLSKLLLPPTSRTGYRDDLCSPVPLKRRAVCQS